MGPGQPAAADLDIFDIIRRILTVVIASHPLKDGCIISVTTTKMSRFEPRLQHLCPMRLPDESLS
jgi:hypothetical protein